VACWPCFPSPCACEVDLQRRAVKELLNYGTRAQIRLGRYARRRIPNHSSDAPIGPIRELDPSFLKGLENQRNGLAQRVILLSLVATRTHVIAPREVPSHGCATHNARQCQPQLRPCTHAWHHRFAARFGQRACEQVLATAGDSILQEKEGQPYGRPSSSAGSRRAPACTLRPLRHMAMLPHGLRERRI